MRGTGNNASMSSRRTALTITLLAVFVYAYLSSLLSSISAALSNTDEEEATSYFVALKTLIQIGALLNFGSAVASSIGALSVWTDSQKLLRLYSLYSLFSLGGEMILFVTVCLTIVWNGGPNVVSRLCETFAGHDLTLLGIGWSVESCEDRWESTTFTFFAFAAAICILRGWAALQIISYYTILVNQSRRPRSRTRSSASPTKRKVFLLPKPIDTLLPSSSTRKTGSSDGSNVPLLKLTPSSPARDAFPPASTSGIASSAGENDNSSADDLTPMMPPSPVDEADDYIVYAPVRMTSEQARRFAAQEVSLPTSSTSPSTAPASATDSTKTDSTIKLSQPQPHSQKLTRPAMLPSNVSALRAVAQSVGTLEGVVRDRDRSESPRRDKLA